MPRKFSDEFKDKAVRLAEELVELEGCSKWAAAEEIGEKLGVSAHTLNNWLKPVKASPDVQRSTGESVDDELKRLRQENKELRRANEILKTASAFFAAELRSPTPERKACAAVTLFVSCIWLLPNSPRCPETLMGRMR